MELNRATAVGKGIRAPEIRKQRRKGIGFPQGLIRNMEKLQGPVCKTKISRLFKTLMKKCPKRKLESFSSSTTLL
jgi:hypothetical protein